MKLTGVQNFTCFTIVKMQILPNVKLRVMLGINLELVGK